MASIMASPRLEKGFTLHKLTSNITESINLRLHQSISLSAGIVSIGFRGY
jgi:hypothetical protein